jgi:hypothetical protein
MIPKIRLFSVVLFLLLAILCAGVALGCGDDDDDDNSSADDDNNDTAAGDDDDDDDDDDDNNDDNDDDTLPPGCITGDFEPVFGMLHSHSAFSDGHGTPSEAYEWARDQGDLDFFALTDHLEILYLNVPPNKWEILNRVADEFNDPGAYVALVGFEYSLGIDHLGDPVVFTAHNNVFFADELMSNFMFDYHQFYQELAACENCLAQFNHPGWDGQTNWNGFEYVPGLDPQLVLIELSTWGVDAWPFLFECLDQGWHVSPTWNQDNHSREWGTEDDHRTGAWVSELTRPGIREVMEQQRTFSTLDKNATIALMAEGVCWMGSQLTGTLTASLEVFVDDPEPEDGFDVIELFGRNMELLGQVDCAGAPTCDGGWDVTLAQDGYVVARATQTDGDELVSAPIWLSAAPAR